MLNEIKNIGVENQSSLPAQEVERKIRSFRDAELLSATKSLVERERELTTLVFRHLEEIERRKLYADLHYPSLFEYAVRELKYCNASAQRRISAMRLIKEIPEIEEKIELGVLSLSNISQAQSYFREMRKAEPQRALRVEDKMEILSQLENKSTREGERILLSITPPSVLPRERERIVSPEHTKVKFLIDQALKAKLEEVRSLLGPKGQGLGLAELVAEMATLSAEKLKEKRFGKRRVAQVGAAQTSRSSTSCAGSGPARRTRYISAAVKHSVWQAAGGKCSGCGSKHQLQFDHVQPVALGGESTPENLQLLCSSCNLRRGVKTFGMRAMKRVE